MNLKQRAGECLIAEAVVGGGRVIGHLFANWFYAKGK